MKTGFCQPVLAQKPIENGQQQLLTFEAYDTMIPKHIFLASLFFTVNLVGTPGAYAQHAASAPGAQTAREGIGSEKKVARLWYEAFNTRDRAVIDRILSPQWVDIPAPPGQQSGPAGLKQILEELTIAFPDLRITIQEVLQDGDKVIVRSEIEGTHERALMGFEPKKRKMRIQAVDIHQIQDGKILRTWHTEDWLTGLHQLGVFEK